MIHQSKWNHTSQHTEKHFITIINLEKMMGNEELTNGRHLLKMLVKQRIRTKGGIQAVIESRGKRDVAIHYVKSMACQVVKGSEN